MNFVLMKQIKKYSYSDFSLVVVDNEEQFILSNKKNEFILPNVEKDKSNKELNAENTIFDLNEDFRTNIEFNDISIVLYKFFNLYKFFFVSDNSSL